MKIKLLTLVLLACLLVVSSGCSKKSPSVPQSPLSSPLPLQAGQSPLPAPVTRKVDIIQFQLDKPISAGATRVAGRGPVGVPIMLIDITFAGPVLALGEVDKNGEFELKLDEPLEANHRIGLALGNLSGTGWQSTDFSSEFYGDEAMSVPQVGHFFDTCIVAE